MNKKLHNEIMDKIAFKESDNTVYTLFRNIEYYFFDDSDYSRIILILKYYVPRTDISIPLIPKDIMNIINRMAADTYYIETIDGYCSSCRNGEIEFGEGWLCSEKYKYNDYIYELIGDMTVHIDELEFQDYLYKKSFNKDINELSFVNE